MPELMSELLRSRIGAQCDATIGVDAVGTGFFDGGSNVVLCLGMCGQMIYVNRAAEMVAAKLSTQPHSHEPHMLDTLRAFDAVAHELTGITR
jgi:CubicO group peptidase (beta-lactamase class C family)